MSPTTIGRYAARATVFVRKIISSIVTGTVVPSWPRTTIAAVSPTRITSTPASSAKRAPGASYAVTIAILSPRRFISASSGSGSLPAGGALIRRLLPGGNCRSGGRGQRSEVPRPEFGFESVLVRLDPRAEVAGIQLVGGRREDDVDAGALGKLQVALLVPRVAREVVGGRELRLVHEEAHDDSVALTA